MQLYTAIYMGHREFIVYTYFADNDGTSLKIS